MQNSILEMHPLRPATRKNELLSVPVVLYVESDKIKQNESGSCKQE
jgi:hypothetical protein